jgi:hypothetical protein
LRWGTPVGWREKAEFWQAVIGQGEKLLVLTSRKAGHLAWAEDNELKLDLDDEERRAIVRSLVERKARLIENIEDTARNPAARRSGSLELTAIASVLRKLRLADRQAGTSTDQFE